MASPSNDKLQEPPGSQRANTSSSISPEVLTNKTKSNAIDIPSIALPKGAGAIKGIDKKWAYAVGDLAKIIEGMEAKNAKQ